MKPFGYILLVLTLTSFLSCRFSKPLVPVRISKSNVAYSSADNSKKVKKQYLFISLMRVKHRVCVITKVYDSEGTMTSKVIWRSDQRLTRACMDCGRWATKTKYYNSSGQLTRVNYKIVRGGDMNKTLVDKSVFYENGKKTRKVNRLKKGE